MSARTIESDVGGDSSQFGLTTTLDGKGYFWRPWFITYGLKLNYAESTTDSDTHGPGGKQHSEEKLLSGDVHVNTLPRSRYPGEIFGDFYDSRVETDTVGVPLADVNTLHRERIGLSQQYRTEDGSSSYAVQGSRTHVDSYDSSTENTQDGFAAGSHRFGSNSIDYRLTSRDTVRDDATSHKTDAFGSMTLRHQFMPSARFSIDTVLDRAETEQRVDAINQRANVSSSANNFITWRSEDTKWTVRSRTAVQQQEGTVGTTPTSNEVLVTSAGATYEWSSALRFTGDADTNRTHANNSPEIVRSSQSAGLVFSPAPIPLGPVQYQYGATASLVNNDASNAASVQTLRSGLRHGIVKISTNDTGRTVTMSLNQELTEFQRSTGTDLATLNHLGSVAAIWNRPTTTTLAQVNLSHSHTSGTETDTSAAVTRHVNRVIQSGEFHQSHEYNASRFTTWDEDFRVSASRQEENGVVTRGAFTAASAGYGYNHAFRVDRLTFRSRIEYSLRQTTSDRVDPFASLDPANQNEERASWDNRFDYTIGLLSLTLRRTVTEFNLKRRTTTTVSATRVF